MSRPRELGRFRILSTLGRGGMGTVYRAEDPVIQRRVAIKEILVDPTGGQDEQATQYERFVQEFRSAGALSHPSIVTIFDVGQVDGAYFIAMELVDGESLAQRLRREPRPPLSWVAEVVEQIADGLQHAHRQGVLHRDVKPGNILLGADGRVKLTDFGIAKLLEADRSSRPATVVGTPGYMAPEQVRGRAVDGRADQFALAVLAYQMLVGLPPFRGDSMSHIIYKLLHEAPETPSACRPDLPTGVDTVLMRALAAEPDDRYPCCTDFAAALASALGGPATRAVDPRLDDALTMPVPTRVAEQVGPRRWRMIAGLGTAAAVLAVIVLALSGGWRGGTVDSGDGVDGPGADAGDLSAGGGTAVPVTAPSSAAPVTHADAGPPAGSTTVPPVEPDTESAATVPVPQPTRLRVTSEPAGARIRIDGVDTGKDTPAELAFEADRDYRLELRLAGHEAAGWRFRLDELSAAQRRDGLLHFPMTAAGPRSTLAVTADYPVTVVVGDRRHGPTPRHEIDVMAGRQEVRLLAPELFLDRTVPLNLEAGERTLLNAPVAVVVRLAAQPGNCTIRIDGRDLTEGPPTSVRMAAGRHTFVFTWPDGRVRRTTQAVSDGQRIFATPP